MQLFYIIFSVIEYKQLGIISISLNYYKMDHPSKDNKPYIHHFFIPVWIKTMNN